MGEYAEGSSVSAPKAWMSKSLISFDYRVVEVPSGKLLDPACDALVFGHLDAGSAERTAAMERPQRRLVVIDETVDDLYGAKVRAYFESRGVAHEILRLPLTEENKSVELTLKVCEKMKKFNIDRRTEPVIAIGGGVTLDVVGLAASLFRRKTPYIRVPTTSLAYVDASVGAKNGCNFLSSKNRLGTYVPPVAALLDSSFFKTQQPREVTNSLGEMCKMAIMKSEELFGLLEVPVYSPGLTREFFKEAMIDRVKNSMGMRLPLPVGIGKARMFNDVSDASFEETFVQWEKLCKP